MCSFLLKVTISLYRLWGHGPECFYLGSPDVVCAKEKSHHGNVPGTLCEYGDVSHVLNYINNVKHHLYIDLYSSPVANTQKRPPEK